MKDAISILMLSCTNFFSPLQVTESSNERWPEEFNVTASMLSLSLQPNH